MYIYKKYYYKNNNNSSYNLLSIFVLFFLYNCCDFIFLLKNCVLFSCIMLINLDGLQIFKKMNDILDNNKNKIVNTVFDGIDKILNSQSYLFDFYDKFYFLLYNDTLNAFIMKKNDDNKMNEMSYILKDIKNKINNLNSEMEINEKKIEEIQILNKQENEENEKNEMEELDFNELIKMMSENIKKTMNELNNDEENKGTNLLDLNKILDMANNSENLDFNSVKELLNKEETEDDINEFLIK